MEDPNRPLMGPNVKALEFWGLLLPKNTAKKYMYMFLHISIIVFTATEYMDIWYVKSDIKLLLENLKITMLATMSVVKVTTFLSYQKDWKNIIEYVTESDINQRKTKDETNSKIIDEFTKYCRVITYLYWSLMYTTVAVVMIQPLIKYFFSPNYRLNVSSGNESYLQVVSSWVPFDKNTLYGYLAASAFQSYAAIYGGGWITSFDTNAVVIMVFFKGELELLRRDSATIFGSLKEAASNVEMKKTLIACHKRHADLVKDGARPADYECISKSPLVFFFDKDTPTLWKVVRLPVPKEEEGEEETFIRYKTHVTKYSTLFDSCLSPIMMLYMFVCSVMLCVTAYQITSETNLMEMVLQVEYLVFGVSQLFFYCWHSNDVLYTSQDLVQGPYESIWFTRNLHRKDLTLLLAQFRKEIVFSAGPFAKLTVPTFIAILKGAYSYYTLLNQSQINKP